MRDIMAVDTGGGSGDPAARSKGAIIADIRDGCLGRDAAEKISGVSPDGNR